MTTDDDMGRTEQVYDWWGRHPRALDVLYDVAFLGHEREIRRQAIETVGLTRGECVFEVGCGNGNSFPAMREAVGSEGAIVGLDASREMVRSARARIHDASWQNVSILRGDAQRPPLAAGTFDAAYASMSLSAVAESEQAIAAIEALLRPGGRLVVLDARPFEQWPWRIVNPIIISLGSHATNWLPQIDLVAVLDREFESVDVTTFNAGSIFVACARTTRH